MLRRILAAAPRDHAAANLLGIVLQHRGDHQQAVAWLRKAADIGENIAPYHGNLGNAYLMTERFADAAACYRRVLALEPGSPLARFGLGMAHIGQRDFAAAATELTKATIADPGLVDAHSNLGTALAELGRHDDAAARFERALALRPGSAVVHFKYGLALKNKGDLLAACRHLARAAEIDPALVEARFQLGVTLLALGRLEEASRALEATLKLRPDMVPALYELGHVLNHLQKFEDAAAAFARGIALDPRSPLLYQGLARTRHLQGQCESARTLIAQALAHGGDAADCHTMLGLVLQSEGRFDEAIAAYRQAIAANPEHGQAHLSLALVDKSQDPAARIRELGRLRAQKSLDVERRATLDYALAKEHENVGDHDSAFLHYRSANELRKTQYPFDDQESAHAVERLIGAFGKDLFAGKAGIGNPSESPVYIVGMMRSGTTLVEQILASHPRVHGHGELDHIRQIASALPGQMGQVMPYPECVAALDAATALRLAGEQLARLDRVAPDAARHIDKLPHNFERLGLIALLFPRARIIHCTRDPIDTCLSGYFRDFGADHRFTCDLGALGRFYRLYRRLMAHWTAVLPNQILEVPYEAMVADQEGWSRRLVAFLDLPWDDRCLAFHQNQRPVYTYSLWQVRQPIYTSSVERWRPYGKHLGPLFDALEMPRPAL